ncbi:Mannosyl-oligosaccharide alpha-1 [Diplonema papillatum]|nr:Mannosyl-oligosaccharide alpha-1 [Diplonema papillatum]
MHAEFDEGIAHLTRYFDFNPSGNVGLFETTIRVLGGLLSAYALSEDPKVLRLAVSAADQMIPAYSPQVAPGGVVKHAYNPKTRRANDGYGTYLAEGGSVQLEYRYLTHASGNRTYDTFAMRIFDKILKDSSGGMVGNKFDGSRFSGNVNLGSYSDSYYEYLLKLFLLTGSAEAQFQTAYMKAAERIVNDLTIPLWPGSSEMFVAAGTLNREGRISGITREFEHLACFVPGMLALGSASVPDEMARRHMKAAQGIAEFCYNLYKNTTLGLSPDVVYVNPDGNVRTTRPNYGLRPETVESLFYLWRVTKDQKYRDWGWSIYQAIEKHCRVCSTCAASGYSEVADVNVAKPRHTGHMDTFFTGETLKYLYLLFADDSALDLDCWVFNTEAHPFPKFPAFTDGQAAIDIPAKCRKVKP